MGEKSVKNKLRKKQKLICSECGLILSVDEVCGCVDYCDVICCGKQMKFKS